MSRAVTALFLAIAAAPGCEVTTPSRSDAYPFGSPGGNLVFRWTALELPVTYYAQPIGDLPQYVEDGLDAWHEQLLYGEFRGRLTADSAGARVRVEMEGSAPPAAALSGQPVVAACDGRTTVPVSPDNRLSGPIVIRVRWFATYTPEQVANCLAAVTAHEIGHSLGLLQHSPQADDLMFGPPFGFPQVREPSPRDRSTVQLLYHTPPDIQP